VKKNFLVAGLGTFGRETALALADGGGDVLALDMDVKAVDRVKDRVSKVFIGDVTDDHTMEAIGAFDVDVAVVAIRRHFDVAILVTHSLKTHGVKKIIAQVDSERQGDAILTVGATDVIFPHRDIAIRTAKRLLSGNLVEMLPLNENMAVVELSCPDEFIGKDLRMLDLRKQWGVSVLAIQHAGLDKHKKEAPLINPPAETILRLGDTVILLGSNEQLVRMSNKLKDHPFLDLS